VIVSPRLAAEPSDQPARSDPRGFFFGPDDDSFYRGRSIMV